MLLYRGLVVVALLGGQACVVAAEADDQVRGWFEKMTQAVHNLNYQGTFIYLHDNQLESMQVTHVTDEDGERERLISLNGAAREVVRDSASVTCVAPDMRSVSIGRRAVGDSFRAAFSLDVDALSSNYEFRLLDTTRIAGRPVQGVAILPKDRFRYGYRLYLDRDNGLPLKTEMLNDSARPVSQVMFTSLQLNPDTDVLLPGALEGSEGYQWEQQPPMQVMHQSSRHDWDFNGLPPGFHVVLHARRPPVQGSGAPVDHFVLSDGLASVSVYVERLDKDGAWQGATRMGAVNAFGRMLNGYQITVVGSVPAMTVESVAKALYRVKS